MNHSTRSRGLAILSPLLLLAAAALYLAGGGGVLCALALVLCAAGGAALAAAFLSRRETDGRQDGQALLEQVRADAQAGYGRVQQHNEEVRLLRHDMKKHFYALRQLAEGDDPRLIQYLDDLIEEEETVPPVIHSGGPLLSAVLNGVLSRAESQGTAVRILRDQAPSELPLSDRDLCSLVLNVMENALEATAAPGLEDPYISLDLYTKGDFFFFTCENARSPGSNLQRTDRDSSRGLGLKIIRRLTEENGGLVQIDEEPDRYRVSIALPVGSGAKAE